MLSHSENKGEGMLKLSINNIVVFQDFIKVKKEIEYNLNQKSEREKCPQLNLVNKTKV